MKQRTYKCRLLSDVIISQRSATVGSHTTLDFIPGGNFYGIVAQQVYQAADELPAADLFTLCHSGAVKFGDAHPAWHETERSLRVPAAMYYPKLRGITETYLHPRVTELSQQGKRDFSELQLKQCRDGFYVFREEKGIPVTVERSYALKSAYDRESRRAQDAQMYGYESLNKGAVFLFSVVYDEARVSGALWQRVQDALVGVRRIGRSRTAQYGLVEIEPVGEETELRPTSVPAHAEVTLYADARLIFWDSYGQPTCRPTAADFGVPQGEIVWEKSQIRTFQYAPWNYKRQAYDVDRYGWEKGSVVVIRTEAAAEIPPFVGAYQLEGFGRIVVNPVWLQAHEDGTARYALQRPEAAPRAVESEKPLSESAMASPLLRYVVSRHNQICYTQMIYQQVDAFVSAHQQQFRTKTFASQWGNIRRIAMRCATAAELRRLLYEGEGRQAYLTHGVAQQKWLEYNRLSLLQKFVDEAQRRLPDAVVPMAVVNLAAEMGKKCSTIKEKKS